MAAPRTDTRDRIIRSAARLFQRQGYLGTGLVQVVEECAAPRGSIYFHFRGGKEELALEVIELWARGTVDLVDICVDSAEDVAGAVVVLAQTLADTIERSGFVQGCAVATMALEVTPASEALREACDRLFREWQGSLRHHLIHAGVSVERAESLASLIVSALEGALILARTSLSPEPVVIAGQELSTLVSACLATPSSRNSRATDTQERA